MDISRTLYNWMMDPDYPTITRTVAKRLVDTGKVEKGKEKQSLIPFSQLEQWGVV